jgi:hypothetical protein
MNNGMLFACSLQGIDIVVSGLRRGFMAWRYKEWGGIRKAETEVVRIKGRRRDKGGEGGRSKSIGWEDHPRRLLFYILNYFYLRSLYYILNYFTLLYLG